ncbi:N-6 DNA methylase [Fodinicola acaciae]|uniref:N-6 DNA methylase n=1 Tax=Fodinicola acaciae TaxID=2681555 RepID=UPI0013D39A0D|nr:N-6 DNA methylase [Fodinicola acaciae]
MTAAERKARGAFFTPPELCRYVVDWAVRAPADAVLEPSCGEAAFLLAAAEKVDGRGELHGVELHAASAAGARSRLARAGARARVRVADFFTVPPAPRYDAVIGNPPYVRYQDFAGQARLRSQEAALRAGVSLSGLASSWAAFTVHSALFLKPGGRLGLVLPAELLSVNYAAGVRKFLMTRFRNVRLVLFTERVFPGVLEEVVLLLADGFDQGPTDHCELFQATNLADLPRAVGRRWTPPTPEHKWTASLLSAGALAAVDAISDFTELETWGDTTLGMVTGNNRYFALSERAVTDNGLDPGELLRLSPPGSRHLRGLAFTEAMWRELAAADRAVHLFRPEQPSEAARLYIKAGEQVGIDTAYKCRVRKPWWRVPLVPPAHILLTYMNADTPRLCANRARVHHLNSVHGVYLRPGHVKIGLDLLPLAALNSMTLLGAEVVGRAYGGGMLKLEPKEADKLPVPSRELLREARADLLALQPAVTAAVQNGAVTDAAALVDEVLLVRHLGLRRKDIAALREAHADLHGRRLARGRGPDA